MTRRPVVFAALAVLGISGMSYDTSAELPLKGSGLQSLSRIDVIDQPEPVPTADKKSPMGTDSMRVDRITLKPEKATVKVDATKHCVYVLNKHPTERDGAICVELERGAKYTITAAGEAFQSAQVGRDADPFPGVVLVLRH
jgi:hypothetical protein